MTRSHLGPVPGERTAVRRIGTAYGIAVLIPSGLLIAYLIGSLSFTGGQVEDAGEPMSEQVWEWGSIGPTVAATLSSSSFAVLVPWNPVRRGEFFYGDQWIAGLIYAASFGVISIGIVILPRLRR